MNYILSLSQFVSLSLCVGFTSYGTRSNRPNGDFRFGTPSGHPIRVELFDQSSEYGVWHFQLSKGYFCAFRRSCSRINSSISTARDKTSARSSWIKDSESNPVKLLLRRNVILSDFFEERFWEEISTWTTIFSFRSTCIPLDKHAIHFHCSLKRSAVDDFLISVRNDPAFTNTDRLYRCLWLAVM